MFSHSSTRFGIIASCKPWGKEVYDYLSEGTFGFRWYFATNREELMHLVNDREIELIFFVHWNWLVPNEITSKIKCLCLHMTDLPFGRGGSPLQNLILRGHTETKLTIFQMNDELDAGPIFIQRTLNLEGSAHKIYLKMTELSKEMIEQIITKDLTPIPQKGSPTVFRRRKPQESKLPLLSDLISIYDFIRMLDAPTYPAAFIIHGEAQIIFSNAKLEDGKLTAIATFSIEGIDR